MDVVSVSDGTKAIARLEEDVPDIVLADVSMPGRDGYQLAEHIKSNPVTAHVPVILMTGAFEPLDEERARRVCCDAVLAKPFEPHMVISLVKQLLNGAAAAPPAPPAPAGGSEAQAAVGPGAPKSLDDYLERLDDALTAATSPLPLRALEHMADRSGAAAATLSDPRASDAVLAGPSDLSAAFESLLAEELDDAPRSAATRSGLATAVTPAAPAAGVAGAPAALSDELLDDLAGRVAQRLTDAAIRDLVSQRVLEVAERLVREEIERIKNSAR
jgi:CheY-like chemotaxis protein